MTDSNSLSSPSHESPMNPDQVHNTPHEQAQVDASPGKTSQTLSAEVISWKWFLGGLLFFVLVGGLIGALYYYRTVNLSRDILEVVRKMKMDAENATNTQDVSKSHQLKEDAANLLFDYSRKQKQPNVKVLQELNELLEALLVDEGDNYGQRQMRLAQIRKNCSDLIAAMSTELESLAYRERIMEIEWEQRNLNQVIERAREVLRITEQGGLRENYQALRFITLSTLQLLPVTDYHILQAQFKLPATMNELLDKVLKLDPSNIEIAYATASFIINVANREEFQKCASPEVVALSSTERSRLAMAIIDDTVSRNPKEVRAYLMRYEFKKRYFPQQDATDALDPDIATVLKLDPKNSDALIQAGLISYRQSILAARTKDDTLTASKKKQAESYLKQVIDNRPNDDRGYQFLGDFYEEDGRKDRAISTWDAGVEKNFPLASPELIGRLVIALTSQKKFEEAATKLALLPRLIREIRQTADPERLRLLQSMTDLLTARLSYYESREATMKAEREQSVGNTEEAKRLFALAQQKQSFASMLLDEQLNTFGTTAHDYVRVQDRTGIYSKLVGESLLLVGRLMSEQAKWDRAVFYFLAAMPFSQYRQAAAVQAADAYQRLNQPNEALRLLAGAVEHDPSNVTMRYLYMQTMFRLQVSKNNVTPAELQAVRDQLDFLQQHANRIPTPWTIDFRLIHLEMVQENLSNDPEKMLKAQQTAIRKFRALENKEFVVSTQSPVEGLEDQTAPTTPEEQTSQMPKKTYSDDLRFLSELAGIYSNLAQLSDFDRVLSRMRDLPNGEVAYFSERVNDALRRKDRQEVMLIVEESLESNDLSMTDKQRFIAVMQNLKEDDPNTQDKVYDRLKTTFDESPDSLRPQSFFLFANMALDRDDMTYAKTLEERLEKIEGTERGTMWRYIRARRLLKESEPPYDAIRQLQADIAQRRPDWDMTYLLKVMVEERYLVGREDDPVIKNAIIEALQSAIRCGSNQPVVWNRLLAIYEETGNTEAAKKIRRDAIIRGIAMEQNSGQFPQPYMRMYVQVSENLKEDPQQADTMARQCILLAEGRKEGPELIFRLNLEFGKLFLDEGMTDSAVRHLKAVAKRGGTYVYPQAVALAKAKMVDEAFALILDEIDRMPSSIATLAPSILILLSQVQPSEAVFARIDKLMTRIENGERVVLSDTISSGDEDTFVPLKNKRIRSMAIRFPENTKTPTADSIVVVPAENVYDTLTPTETTVPAE